MYCNFCGTSLPADARHCQNCGRVNPVVSPGSARRHLERPRQGRKIAGVCAAVANGFDVDPVLIRLLWLVALFTGFGLIAYIVGWIIIPEEPAPLPVRASDTVSGATAPNA